MIVHYCKSERGFIEILLPLMMLLIMGILAQITLNSKATSWRSNNRATGEMGWGYYSTEMAVWHAALATGTGTSIPCSAVNSAGHCNMPVIAQTTIAAPAAFASFASMSMWQPTGQPPGSAYCGGVNGNSKFYYSLCLHQ